MNTTVMTVLYYPTNHHGECSKSTTDFPHSLRPERLVNLQQVALLRPNARMRSQLLRQVLLHPPQAVIPLLNLIASANCTRIGKVRRYAHRFKSTLGVLHVGAPYHGRPIRATRCLTQKSQHAPPYIIFYQCHQPMFTTECTSSCEGRTTVPCVGQPS
jgi:hypothetical protein